jgi:two-component system OmpR family sensor kinase
MTSATSDPGLETAAAASEPLPRPLAPAPPPEAGERTRQGWFGAARSARTRILASFVILILVSAVISMVALRVALGIRLDDQVDDALEQEVLELDRLLVDGRDPGTGLPFASLRAVFDVYFARNVPSQEEAMLAYVEGEPYLAALARFPVDRVPAEMGERWRALSSSSAGKSGSANGWFDTSLGEARFRATRVVFRGDTGAFVVTILPQAERNEVREIQSYGVAATVGLLVVASALAWLIAGRVLAPVRQLTETARSISQSDVTQRVEVRGTGDAAEMARTFNAMLDRLETVLGSQREFVRDASHELRDPLTICRGHLELLGDDPDERRVTVALVMDELDRMGRIVADLSLLAEAEQPDFLRLEWIDIKLFTHELSAKASALATRQWRLDDVGEGMLIADRHRLTEAVMNLAHNAVQHTRPDDVIAIGTSLGEGEARVWIRDTGLGIPVPDQERIFERFRRGAGAQRLYRGGGLGLAIVKAIAETHGGRIDLVSRPGEGSTFTIVVPQRPSGGGSWPAS